MKESSTSISTNERLHESGLQRTLSAEGDDSYRENAGAVHPLASLDSKTKTVGNFARQSSRMSAENKSSKTIQTSIFTSIYKWNMNLIHRVLISLAGPERFHSSIDDGPRAVGDGVQRKVDIAENTWIPPSTERLHFQVSPKLASGVMESMYPVLPVPEQSGVTVAPIHDGRPLDTYTSGQVSFGDDDEPFRSPLGFHIPKQRLHEALCASRTSTAAYWQYTRKPSFSKP